MNKFKSIELVKAFPVGEITFLKDFFQKNAPVEVVDLLHYTLDSSREDQSDVELWNACYKSKPFKKQQFANYCHQLLKYTEQAICLISLKKKDLKFYDVLLPTLLNWDLLDHYQFSRGKALRRLTTEQAYEHVSFHKHRFDYLHFLSLEKESSRKKDLNINEASNSLDEYYLILKLRYLCAARSHQNISSSNYQLDFIEVLLPEIENTRLSDHPMIQNYLLVYKLLAAPDNDRNFQTLKSQLNKDRAFFSDSELNEIYIYPINFCIQQINKGSVVYLQELLELYRSLPGFDIDSNEIISPWRFRNVVQLSVLAGELDWAEYFIENYAHRLLDEFRENAVNYNTANLRFHQKRYQDVIPLLIHVEYQDINYALICKILLLKTYFEMKELEAFHSLLESFRLFVLRSRALTGVQRKQYLDLLSILKQLAKMEYADINAIERFKTRIGKREIIADKKWILEKLSAL